MSYCRDLFNYHRRESSSVHVGQLTLGGDAPIRIQSMANTSTMDTEGSVAQAERMIKAGCEIVRFTAQGVREADNLANIRKALDEKGLHTPLVADIHFNPKAAEAAALTVEKVRVNPGNFADPFTLDAGLSDSERDRLAIEKVRERFVPFLNLCKEHHTAIRIGVNHGSLSARMMDRYGDTPEGMVASCMEYLRICVEENFFDVVISIKASNTLIMVQTVRLLVETMDSENMHFPLHLGVTEAGEGEDGRIKSAVGIGTLLADGIGDTIRVSLSEAPEAEVPVARQLRDYIVRREGHPRIEGVKCEEFDSLHFHRRESRAVGCVGGGQVPVVVATEMSDGDLKPDLLYDGKRFDKPFAVQCITLQDLTPERIEALKSLREPTVLLLESHHINAPAEMRAAIFKLMDGGCELPVIACFEYNDVTLEQLQLYAAADAGALLLDGLLDGLLLKSSGFSARQLTDTSYAILQAARQRVSRTEYISCPSCGRTMFDIESTIARIKAGTAHLKGLKIGIMGCIVNGPGEMADADYGYVGAGRGRISLYKGGTCIEKNIPEEEALDKLLQFIESDRNNICYEM